MRIQYVVALKTYNKGTLLTSKNTCNIGHYLEKKKKKKMKKEIRKNVPGRSFFHKTIVN